MKLFVKKVLEDEGRGEVFQKSGGMLSDFMLNSPCPILLLVASVMLNKIVYFFSPLFLSCIYGH